MKSDSELDKTHFGLIGVYDCLPCHLQRIDCTASNPCGMITLTLRQIGDSNPSVSDRLQLENTVLLGKLVHLDVQSIQQIGHLTRCKLGR